MSLSGRRAAWTLVQVLFTALAMVVILRLIRFRDLVKADGGAPAAAVEVAAEGERWRVAWADGTSGVYARAEVVEAGFFSIFGRADKGLFFSMVAALFAPFALMALRWWLLLRGHGFALPYAQVFRVNYAGIFFNHLLPGGVGGDLTKAALAASGEERKAAVVGTVLLDRMIGLAVLIFLGAACLAPFAGRFSDRRIVWAVYGLAGGAVLAYVIYFSPAVRAFLGPRLPFSGVRRQLDGVFRSAKERKGLMAVSALISLASQAVTILAAYGMARALGLDRTPLWMFFVFEPVIFIVNALPISVGGWGVQEAAYAALFGELGGMTLNEAVALSVLFKAGMLLASMPGGVLFAAGAARRKRLPPAEPSARPSSSP